LSKKNFVPAFTPRSLTYTIDKKSSNVWYLHVGVPAGLTGHVRDHVTKLYRQYTIMPGISCSSLPLSYTQEHFSSEIEKETLEFLHTHFVEPNVQSFLLEQGISIVNWPRFKEVTGAASSGYTFTLILSLAPQLNIHSWKSHTFVAPKRKNYTDLDIQVESFISCLKPTDAVEAQLVEAGDWVRFSARFKTPSEAQLLQNPTYYWLRITNPSIATETTKQFLSKAVGDSFLLTASALNLEHESALPTDYFFQVTIENIVKTQGLSLRQVQESLGSTDHQTLHNKLIEIFSYRNDVSLRKAIIEELFYSLLNAYRFEVAPHAITRRKELLLFLMQQTPDNSVYTKQKHFATHITLLAETKLKEEALVDAIAQEEHLDTNPCDIMKYLVLASSDRLKEFLYFSPPSEDALTSEQPCSEYILTQAVRREKALNKIIEQLAL